jgi:hypothetical protein
VRIVVVSGGNKLPSESVVSFVHELGDSAAVSVVTWAPPTDRMRRVCAEVVVLGPLDQPPPAVPSPEPEPTEPMTGASPARISAALRWRRRRLRRFARYWAGRGWTLFGRDRAKAWRRVRHSPRAIELVDGADLVVALDTQAIRAVWTIARRRPGVAAVWGLPAAGVAARRLAVARSALDAEQVAGDS